MKHVILAQSCSMIFIILYSINYLAIAAPSGSNSVEFGVNLGQVPPELLDSLFDDAKYLGVSWVRVDLSWKDMERQRGLRDYSLIETIVSKAESKGLRVLLLLTSPPDWVLKPSFDLEAWRVFVMETVEKLGGHISAWQVMNEPDSPYVNPIPPHLYVEILGTAYDIIKKAGGKGPVVSAAFTPIGTKYVEELHRLGGSKYFDVLALNAYGPSPSASAAVASTFKELLNKLGLGGKPVWITEVGWPVSGEGLYGLLKGVGEREQADNLASVFCLLSSIQGVEKIFWFKLMDGPTGLEETPYWGLMATPEQKRPAYHVYREAVLWLNRPSRMVKLSATTNNILVNDSVMFSLLTDPPTMRFK